MALTVTMVGVGPTRQNPAEGRPMSTHDEQPQHDESADEELSESLEGHEALSEDSDAPSPLEEDGNSPVRTDNS